MNRAIYLTIILLITCYSYAQPVKIGLLKYSGGGDWYANPTSLPNLIDFCNKNLNSTINSEPLTIDVGSSDIFNVPFVHLTGHGNVVFSDSDIKNLRLYLESGGFLHIDDNYGLDKYIRREMKKIFPDNSFIELPFDHPIYHQVYEFEKGLPKIHQHDQKAPQGFGLIYNNRLVCFYTFECDLGDGWEDAEVHNDSKKTRTNALKMGANIIAFVFSQN
ncbi:MAG: DUF4159 domain-containing protein [Salinivirgaceae bacterium]|jgi:hypothetical protein|nr:DUF4159 domain-containing protein [Salinivirgaceae bacterium]